MPQDTDGSGLVSLFWAAWIYWYACWWLSHLSSQEPTDRERRRLNYGASTSDTNLESPPAAIRTSIELEALICAVLRREGSIRIDEFLAERLSCYEAIVAAFEFGDRERLRRLVSAEVYDVFSSAIADREAWQQNRETLFAKFDSPRIVDGLVTEEHIEICVRFSGESFRVMHTAAGCAADSRPEKCTFMDTWTFAKALSSPQGTWLVVATESDPG